MNTRRWISVSAATVACGALAVLGVGGVALASNTASTGQIKACYKTGTTLPPLDHIATSRTCPTGDTSLTWNKVGRQGPQGVQGPPGVSVGASGTSETSVPLHQANTLVPVLSAAPVPDSGTYYVNASAMLVVAQGDTVVCILADNGNAVGAFATVGPVANQTYETVPLSEAISLSAGDTPQVLCSDYTSNSGTSFYDGGITSVLINSATGNGPMMSPRHQATTLPHRL